jgi:uncharacterized protein
MIVYRTSKEEMMENIAVMAVIAVLSVVQSIFGMGVLVFGTPTLLLMGYDFISALGYLLPASFAISVLQVFSAKPEQITISRNLYFLCLPGIGIGLWMAEFTSLASWTNTLIGCTLLLSAMVRVWGPSKRVLDVMLEKHFPVYHLIMGLCHGLTNLGGAMLAILASGTSSDKSVIRYTIAYYYLAFSTVQMLVLAILMGHSDMLIANSFMAVISGVVFLLVGRRIFSRTSDPVYNVALTVFIAIYGAIVLINV